MKGEISQGQWVGFFNTLTATQKSTRDITSATGKNTDNLTYRNNVSWSSGDATLPDQGSGATGSGLRGGAWNSSSANARLSDRDDAAGANSIRDRNYGGRGVRVAP